MAGWQRRRRTRHSGVGSDITVLLAGPPAPFRHSAVIEGWPVEWFVQTEQSLLQFCRDDRTHRRRPTTMRLIGSAIVLIDTDGSGARLQHQLHAMDRKGPPPIASSELEDHRYAVTDLLADLSGAQGDDERLVVATALVWATAEMLLAVNGRWSGSGKWLMRELDLLDSDHSTNHGVQLLGGLRDAAAGDPVPLHQRVVDLLTSVGGPLFSGYHRDADDALGEKYPGVERFRGSRPVPANVGTSTPPWPRWASEAVELVDADPDWQSQGQHLRDILDVLLAPWLTVGTEHIGSTAVPGLPAKPIIDLQAAVTELADAESMAAVLGPHDWHYVGPHVDRRPWRRFFVKVIGGKRIAHLHVMSADCQRWSQQLAFRDALRADPAMAADYAALKDVLAERHSDDREAYTEAKESFIHTILRRTPQ